MVNEPDYDDQPESQRRQDVSVSLATLARQRRVLEQVGVALVPGSAFGAEGYMRISYATSMENLEKAVTRIRQVFES